jgi:hypothetical protein
VRGEICALCCGTAREVTVNCPLDCPYLQESRRHDRLPEPDPAKVPNPDIDISEEFLSRNTRLFTYVCLAILKHALGTQAIVDNDVREALEALARTYRTLESGLVYETRPANLLAAGLQRKLREELIQYEKEAESAAGMETLRDADVLGVLVMLQRIEYARSNGRPRGRAFLDFLHHEFQEMGVPPQDDEDSGLIVQA